MRQLSVRLQVRHQLLLLILLLLLCSGFTCKHSALQTSTGVAASLTALQDGEIALHDNHTVTDTEHVTLEKGFKLLFQEDKVVRQCIYSIDAPTCVDSGIAAINNFVTSDVNGIKNPDSQTKMKLLAQAVIASLNTLKAAL